LTYENYVAKPIFLPSYFISYCQGNDISGLDVIGNVSSISLNEYTVKDYFGEIVKNDEGKLMVRMFNKDGNLLKITGYNLEGNMFYSSDISYNERGNRTEEYHYGSDGSLRRKRIYKYDAKGNMINEREYDSDGELTSSVEYKYDIKRNKIEEYQYNSEGNLSIYLKDQFDENNNRIESCFITS